MPSPTSTPSAEPSVEPSPSSSPAPAAVRVVINEVAWAGTASDSADEWIELYNAGDSDVDLTGWGLHADADANGKTLLIALSGTIRAGGYFLIERTDDRATSIQADLFGPFGGSGLRNTPGERLQLRDASGTVVDAADCSGGDWFAGDSSPVFASMERIDPMAPGSDSDNWASNDGNTMVGADAGGNPIRGTPAYRNSVTREP